AESRRSLDSLQFVDEVGVGDDARRVGVAVRRWEVRIGYRRCTRGQWGGQGERRCDGEGGTTTPIRWLLDVGHLRLASAITCRRDGTGPRERSGMCFPTRTCLEITDEAQTESRKS